MNNDLKISMKLISSDNINMKLEDSKEISANMSGGIIETDPIFTDSPAYTITYEDITEWNDKSNFSGNYNDLTNKPIIPTQISQLNNDLGFITKNVNNLTYYTLSNDLSTVATTGDYDDLLDKPTIPTDTSDLTNNAGFITNTVNNLINYTLSSSLANVATTGSYNDLLNTPNLANVATSGLYSDLINKPTLSTVASTGDYDDLIDKPTIPTKTSDLQNDSGFITSSSVPTKTSDLTNDSGFVTNTDYSSYATGGVVRCNSNGFNVNSSGWPYSETFTYAQYSDKTNAHFISKGTLENVITGKGLVSSSSLSTVATTGSYNDLSNKPTIPTAATLNVYSNNEVVIGTWINNKPLYRRVYTFPALKNNDTSELQLDSSFNVVTFDIYVHSSSDNLIYKLPYVASSSTNTIAVYLYTVNNKLSVRTFGDRTNYNDNYAIIEYTKTTD